MISLSQTIKGLHWDRIPGDNDEEVGARGILYLLIFQQLGQLVRWSWGYHVLLAPKDKYDEYNEESAEQGQYRDEAPEQHHDGPLIDVLDGDTDGEDGGNSSDSQIYMPAGRTPVANRSRASLAESNKSLDVFPPKKAMAKHPTALGGNQPALNGTDTDNDILSFPRIRSEDDLEDPPTGIRGVWVRILGSIDRTITAAKTKMVQIQNDIYERLPKPLQTLCRGLVVGGTKANRFFWEFMNPPLWAMLIAVLVASVPALQQLFFQEGSFVKNSVTSAIRSNGNVAVPLILVVLGANLARNTMAKDDTEVDPEEERIGTKILVASLLCRMLLPTCILAPILALLAKYLTISILDDPIFVIVCFLLTGAPSALQLAQICQINNVYEKTMGRILFQSYVIW